MERTEIKDLYKNQSEYGGREVVVCGWVRSVRAQKTIGFIELSDGSFFKSVQVVFEEGLENFSEVSRLNVGSAVLVRGTMVPTPNARQPFEIKAGAVEVIGESPLDYPLQKKRHSFEFLRTIAHLRARTNTFSAVFRVRSRLAHAIHSYFQDRGFVYIHTPIITASDAEGAGEMFRVTTLKPGETDFKEDFFGKKTGLTVSGQLEAEAFAMAFGKVYTFGPTFRAEKSNTPRHAAEFWMVEPEMAFADLKDDMNEAESMLKYIIKDCLNNLPEEMEFFNSFVEKGLVERLQNIIDSDFERITYTEAIKLLEKKKEQFEYPVYWGADLQTEHERYITEQVFKKPVFVTDYPKEIKAFYMRQNDDGRTVAAMDLLVPGVGELIGGSQREERYERLAGRMNELGLDTEEYGWYLDLRRFGTTPHAGFGLGFERAVMYLTGMSNIRDVICFPRTVGSANF